MTAQAERELPVRVVDTPAGVVLRTLCGGEASSWAPEAPGTVQAVTDLSPAGLMRVILHARRCKRCAGIALEREVAR